MHENKINIVAIGCGLVFETAHLPALLNFPEINIVALVDNNIRNAERLNHTYNLNVKLETSIDNIDNKIDGAIITTPNHTHYHLIKKCLEKNIAVLVEKPMCITVEEAEDICKQAELNQSIITVGYTTRYYPNIQLFKELLSRRYFGELISYEYEFGSPGGWSPMSGYNLDKKKCGGGVLVVNGTHILDRLLYWFGEPYEVEYEDDSYGGIEANCKAKLFYNNDYGKFVGNIFLSKTAKLKNKFWMESTNYLSKIIEGETENIEVYPKAENAIKYNISASSEKPIMAPFVAQLDNFLNCIKKIDKPTIGCTEAKKSVYLIEKLYSKKRHIEESWLKRI